MLSHAWSWMLSVAAGLRGRDEGATMVEYGLLVALIAIVAAVTVTILGGGLQGLFGDVADQIGTP